MLGIGLTAAAAVTGAACSSETGVSVAPGVESTTSIGLDTTTPGTVSGSNPVSGENLYGPAMDDATHELASRILNPLGVQPPAGQFNQDFDCVSAAKKSDGYINVITMQGVEVVEQILPRNMSPDVELSDAFHRKWASAISRPFIGDLTDNESLKQQNKLAFCAEPVFLGTFVESFMNDGRINGLPVSESEDLPDFLKRYRGLDVNQVINLLANPFDNPTTASRKDANLKVTQVRQAVAEWASAVLDLLQPEGIKKEVDIRDTYELEIDSLVNPLELPIVGLRPAYKGEEAYWGWTKKETCKVIFRIAFNAGNGTEKGIGGDKSPRILLDIDCEGEETPSDTTPGTTPGTNPPGTTPPHGTRVEVAPPAPTVVQGPGAGGTPDNDNDPNNNTGTSLAPTTTYGGPNTTIKASSVTSTTLGECGPACD